jgi:hypothetical protein
VARVRASRWKPRSSIDGKTKDEIAWEQYAAMFGLELGWLHQTFEHKRNQVVEIIGLAPTRSRFPVMVKDAKTGNANILLTIEEVQRKLGNKSKGGLVEVAPPPRT